MAASSFFFALRIPTPYCSRFFGICQYIFYKNVYFFENFLKWTANCVEHMKDKLPKSCKNRPQDPSCGKFPEKSADGKTGKIAQAQVAFADPEAQIDPSGKDGR